MAGNIESLGQSAARAQGSVDSVSGLCNVVAEDARTASNALATAYEFLDQAGTALFGLTRIADRMDTNSRTMNLAAEKAEEAAGLVPNGECAARASALQERCNAVAGNLAVSSLVSEASGVIRELTDRVLAAQNRIASAAEEIESIQAEANDLAGGRD